MANKQKITLPSIKEMKKGNLEFFSMVTKLEKKNIELLEEHGYNIIDNVSETTYKLFKKDSKSFLFPYLLHAYIIFQDIFFRGSFFNSDRKGFMALFLKEVYGRELNEKQKKEYIKVFGDVDSALDQEHSEVKLKKIILLSSNSNKVGKTVFSETLEEALLSRDYIALKKSFMDPTRNQLSIIFTLLGIEEDAWTNPQYNLQKNDKHDYGSFKDVVLRNLLCDYSDLLQKHFGKDVWAHCMAQEINDNELEYVVIDDLRRPIELEYLINTFGRENILTVYLEKDGVDVLDFKNLSDSAVSYENQLDKNSFDIVFKFSDNWENSDKLLTTILDSCI